MVRTPAVAGQFYEGSKAGLHSQVEKYVEADAEKEEVKAVLSPHAGLMYSGSVAGAVYSRIKFPQTFILLGPNHTGMGPRISMVSKGIWEIPTAALSIDEGLAASIAENCPSVTSDTMAHRYEHSLEVQLPFIAHFSTDVKIVPINVMQATVDELVSIGEGIAEAVKGAGYPVVVVASSDMSHFIPEELAREKDRLAIDKVLALDARGLFSTVIDNNISMCGFMPTTMMLSAAKALGATEAKLVKYTTSAEVSGDYRSVVGYAGVLVK
jgi:AmmeMemoRadiSam system protein B